MRFSSAFIPTMREDPAEAEERFETLDKVHGLVRQLRETRLPDSTFSIRYKFVHALYRFLALVQYAGERSSGTFVE